MKSTLHMKFRGLQVPNFNPFHSKIGRFQDIVHLRTFPLAIMLEKGNCQVKKKVSLYNFNFNSTSLFSPPDS